MKVAVFGGSGFIGRELVRALMKRDDEVTVVSRASRPDVNGIRNATWAELAEQPSLLEGFDAFVNLAGETINQRWTDKAKERILNSRLTATKRIATIIERLKAKPEVLINGSGMSIYGYSEHDIFDERSPSRLTDFLGQTVDAWEREADRIEGVRIVKLRIGLVLGTSGGAFPLMSLPYRFFVGGKVGSGKQWHSWIHVKDMVGIILYGIDHREVSGPINCTAPNPVANDRFGRVVAQFLGKPYWFPVPAFMLKIVLGEMSEVLLEGQQVLPGKILEAGYSFRYQTLEEALEQLLKRRT